MMHDISEMVNKKYGSHLPRFQWYEFSHSFSPLLLDWLINEYSHIKTLDKSTRLFDPFCGSGTLSLRAAQKKIECVSSDLLPSSYHITKAKVSRYNLNNYWELSDTLLQLNIEEAYTDVKIMHSLYSPESLGYLLSLSKAISSFPSPYNSLFYTILFRVAEAVANGKKSGATYRIQDKSSQAGVEDVTQTLRRKLNDFEKDLEIGNDIREGAVGISDARSLDREFVGDIDWIITSPPYPNRQDYTRIFAPELTLCFSPERSHQTALRKKTLRSHLEARSDTVSPKHGIYSSMRVEEWVDSINKSYTDARIGRMLHGYFDDMYLMMSNWLDVLSENGLVTLITSNAKYANVNIEVDDEIKVMASSMGYRIVSHEVVRFRGNAPQQMKNYKRTPMRETIITLQK